MIRMRERSVTPVLRGLLIMMVAVVLLMYVSQAGAYMPPPVQQRIDVEGDGDDFYNHRNRLGDRPATDGLNERNSGNVDSSPAGPIVSNPWDTRAPEPAPDMLVRLSRWAWIILGIRGF